MVTGNSLRVVYVARLNLQFTNSLNAKNHLNHSILRNDEIKAFTNYRYPCSNRVYSAGSK
jgi:hypothetical protein